MKPLPAVPEKDDILQLRWPAYKNCCGRKVRSFVHSCIFLLDSLYLDDFFERGETFASNMRKGSTSPLEPISTSGLLDKHFQNGGG